LSKNALTGFTEKPMLIETAAVRREGGCHEIEARNKAGKHESSRIVGQ
jgi:hypothetical protein